MGNWTGRRRVGLPCLTARLFGYLLRETLRHRCGAKETNSRAIQLRHSFFATVTTFPKRSRVTCSFVRWLEMTAPAWIIAGGILPSVLSLLHYLLISNFTHFVAGSNEKTNYGMAAAHDE